MSFTVGTQLSVNPILENDYAQTFQNMEVPIDDAIVLSHFMHQMNHNLQGEKFSKKQVSQAISDTIA